MKKLLFAVPLFFACFFIAVGYAATTATMTITGSAEATPPPKGLFITDVELVASSDERTLTAKTQRATLIRPQALRLANTPFISQRKTQARKLRFTQFLIPENPTARGYR